jgi:hypothetical protein
MPQISVDLLINRTLYARGPVQILDSALNVVATRQAGQVVGEVDSWIQRAGTVYLTLKPFQTVRLVKVPNANLSLSKTEAADVFGRQEIEDEKKRAELERLKREQMGPVTYYVKKFGPVLLAVIAGTYLLGTYIKKRA